MKVFAVIDTNVIVSALLTRNPEAATVKIFEALFQSRITPLLNDDIINEYTDVLHRPKFRFPPEMHRIPHRDLAPGHRSTGQHIFRILAKTVYSQMQWAV